MFLSRAAVGLLGLDAYRSLKGMSSIISLDMGELGVELSQRCSATACNPLDRLQGNSDDLQSNLSVFVSYTAA